MLFGHGGRVVQAFFAEVGGLVSIDVLQSQLPRVLKLVKTRGPYAFMLLGKALSAHFLCFLCGRQNCPSGVARRATEGGLQRTRQSHIGDISPRAARLPTKWAVDKRRNRGGELPKEAKPCLASEGLAEGGKSCR